MREITDPFALYYRLKTPCSKCPFRKDSPIELRPGRLEGIVETLLKDQTSTFTCHNTFSSTRDDDDCDDDAEDSGSLDYRNGEKMCAGAAAYLMKVQRPSVGMRYAMHSGSIAFDQWDKAAVTVIDPIILNTKY